MKRLILAVLVMGVLLLGACAPARISEPPIPTQEIEDGWIRIIIKDVGSIDYPSDFLELQSGYYRDVVKEYYQILELGISDFTLQQVGLNDLLPSAFEEYRRVTFTTDYLSTGEEVFRAGEKYTLNQEELAEIQNELISQVNQEFAKAKSMGLGNIRIIDPGSVVGVEVNGMYPILITYNRQLDDNPVVLVKIYLFPNYDRMHSLLFSYRVEDEEECRDIYERILYSFRLE